MYCDRSALLKKAIKATKKTFEYIFKPAVAFLAFGAIKNTELVICLEQVLIYFMISFNVIG